MTGNAGTYAALRLASVEEDYLGQRTHDRGMKHRDVGRAIAESCFTLYGEKRTAGLALDSESIRETWAQRFLAELEAAGYRVTFSRLGTHR